MKNIVILRGIPGCGKSTHAAMIMDFALTHNYSSMICSADYFFIRPDGTYMWDAAKIGAAHAFCHERFMTYLLGSVEVIVVDNTNTTKKEYAFYQEEAVKAGYEVTMITVGEFTDEACEKYAARNKHGVPIETIKKMRDRFTL